MNSWKESAKQTATRIYQTEGAPRQAWNWILLAAGAYLLFRLLAKSDKVTAQIAAAMNRVSEGVANVTKIFMPAPERLLQDLRSALEKLMNPPDPSMRVVGTISTIQMAILAENLEAAFKSGLFALVEDEVAILEVFKQLRNDVDFINLYLAFGERGFLVEMNSGNLQAYINKWTPELKPEINELLDLQAGNLLRV